MAISKMCTKVIREITFWRKRNTFLVGMSDTSVLLHFES